MIDLSGTRYRLEGIHDHEDAKSILEGYYYHLYLRVYESVEDRESLTRSSRAMFTITAHPNFSRADRVKCGLLQSRIEGAIDGGTCAPIATADSLDEAVMKLITIHQLSGAGLDTDKLWGFLQEKQRAGYVESHGTTHDDRATGTS